MSEKRKIQRFNLDEGRIWEAIEGLSPFKTTYTLEEVCEKLNEQQAIIEAKDSLLSILSKENEQLKIANAKWLDKSLQDRQIRYDNPTCKELTRKYLQLKKENEHQHEEIINSHKAYVECLNQIKDLKEKVKRLQDIATRTEAEKEEYADLYCKCKNELIKNGRRDDGV